MKQKAAIEKTYAESLHKLSSVYGSKKVASKVAGLEVKDGDHSQHNSGGQSEKEDVDLTQMYCKPLIQAKTSTSCG